MKVRGLPAKKYLNAELIDEPVLKAFCSESACDSEPESGPKQAGFIVCHPKRLEAGNFQYRQSEYGEKNGKILRIKTSTGHNENIPRTEIVFKETILQETKAGFNKIPFCFYILHALMSP